MIAFEKTAIIIAIRTCFLNFIVLYLVRVRIQIITVMNMANFGDTFGKLGKQRGPHYNDSFDEDSDFDRTTNNDLSAVIDPRKKN